MSNNGMKINTAEGKTEYIVISRREEEYEIKMEEEKIKQVTDYKYLGTNINKRNLQEKEIDSRISKYNRNVGMLYPLLRDKFVPRECKITVYNTILKPIIMYGCEAWSLTTKTESKIQAAEMRVLRLVKGVTRRDRVRNVNIRGELGVEPLLDTIERSRLRWYGHVKRMNQDMPANKYLEWKPTGKRPVGRPRKRWVEGVEKALGRRGMSLVEVEEGEIYADREEWRRIQRLGN